ncbi:MAG: ORF6N domain-containing protein [bacterium]
MSKLIPMEIIEKRIFLLRGEKVMIDGDLAELYCVSTKALNQAVKRNREWFPEGFVFRLDEAEKNELVTNCDRFKAQKHSATGPYAFTEQGGAMLSSVLRSKKAIQVNILIMKTFVKLRELISGHKDVLRKVEELERKYDAQFKVVFDALRQIITPPVKPKRIGFLVDRESNEKGGE